MGDAAPVTPPVVSFVGLSGSGKTTLLERVIREFAWRGYRVGTIKHSSHAHQMDTPGKDSWRHREAGAERVLFVGPDALQLVAPPGPGATPASLAARYHCGMDLVLVEGFLNEPGPKVEVVRSARSRRPVCAASDGLFAVASDLEAGELGLGGAAVKVLALDAVEAIVDLVAQRFGLVPTGTAGGRR